MRRRALPFAALVVGLTWLSLGGVRIFAEDDCTYTEQDQVDCSDVYADMGNSDCPNEGKTCKYKSAYLVFKHSFDCKALTKNEFNRYTCVPAWVSVFPPVVAEQDCADRFVCNLDPVTKICSKAALKSETITKPTKTSIACVVPPGEG